MIRTTKAPVAWPVPWADGQAHFMLRAGDVIERGEFEADLSELGAGRVFDFQLEEAFLSGVEALLAGDTDAIGRIRDISAAMASEDTITPDDQALMDGTRELVKQHWPAYAILMKQVSRRGELIPTLAFQRFCTGWEGEGFPEYRKGIDQLVTLECIGEVPPILVRLAGMRAYQMLWATGQEKNFEAPLPPVKSPRPSKSGTREKGGSSRARSGRKTPSSSSRRGASPSSTSGSTADA